MRNIRIAALAAFFVPIILLAGCASPVPMTAPTIASFAPTVQKVCDVAKPIAIGTQNTMRQLTTPLDATDAANIQKAIDDVGAFCAAVSTAQGSDVQTLVNNVFPLLAGAIRNSSMTANGKDFAIIGLGVAQTSIILLVPSVTPSSAPVSVNTAAAK